MIDTLDSRSLRPTDCYGQRFMKVGSYRYSVLAAHTDCMTDERPFTIRAVERKAKTRMTQHTISVRVDAGAFRVDRHELVVEVGDLVLWHCPNQKAPPYMVAGDKEFFGSQRLLNESGYSHAFGFAGEYQWIDAYGGRAAGVVRVHDPQCRDPGDFQRWHKSLTKGTLVMITDGAAEPPEVDIVTGQTVFFAIVKGPGISITDQRLIARAEDKPAKPFTNRTPSARRAAAR